jgi:hypothetical protein
LVKSLLPLANNNDLKEHKMYKQIQTTLLMVAVASLLVGCDDDIVDDQTAAADPLAYEVTVRNLTNGQTLSRPAMVLHATGTSYYSMGAPVSTAVERLAEAGEISGIRDLSNSAGSVFALANSIVEPGQSMGTFVTATATDQVEMTIFSRMGSTNDGFVAANAVSLSSLVAAGDSVKMYMRALDAGTEQNIEGANVGTFDPTRPGGPNGISGSESNIVTIHPGVITSVEPIPNNPSMLPQSAKFDNPVVQVVITRM